MTIYLEVQRLLQSLDRECVGGFRDDDPGYEISYGAYAGEESEECGEDADKCEVPSIVLCEAGADSGDHSVIARAGELAGRGIGSGRRRGRGREGGSAGGAEAGGWFELLAALGAVHNGVSGTILFCHKEYVWLRLFVPQWSKGERQERQRREKGQQQRRMRGSHSTSLRAGFSTPQQTMRLSVAPVEMTPFLYSAEGDDFLF
jgi:hypothetical protein